MGTNQFQNFFFFVGVNRLVSQWFRMQTGPIQNHKNYEARDDDEIRVRPAYHHHP